MGVSGFMVVFMFEFSLIFTVLPYFYREASKNGLRGAKKLAFDWFFRRESLSL